MRRVVLMSCRLAETERVAHAGEAIPVSNDQERWATSLLDEPGLSLAALVPRLMVGDVGPSGLEIHPIEDERLVSRDG
jgi:hypothetical protein